MKRENEFASDRQFVLSFFVSWKSSSSSYGTKMLRGYEAKVASHPIETGKIDKIVRLSEWAWLIWMNV